MIILMKFFKKFSSLKYCSNQANVAPTIQYNYKNYGGN